MLSSHQIKSVLLLFFKLNFELVYLQFVRVCVLTALHLILIKIFLCIWAGTEQNVYKKKIIFILTFHLSWSLDHHAVVSTSLIL